MKKLFPYQKKMVEYIKTRTNAALWCQMRLGKAVTAINALSEKKELILIICPKSVIPSWWEEIEDAQTDAPFEIINYEQLKNYPSIPETIVLDESVKIKSPKAQITKLLFERFLHVPNKILLSGNPAPNTPLEYWTQMAFVNSGEWMGCRNWWQFRKRYFSSDYLGYTWFPKPGTKEKIKEALAKDAFILTRKQAGMKSRKIYEQRYIEMPPAVRKIYRKLEKEFVAQLPDGKELELNNLLSQLIYLQQTAGGFISDQSISNFKVKELVNLLEGELKEEPVVIWTQFRWEQEMIKKAFPTAEVINGDTSLEDRKNIIKGIWNILIISVGCGKFGLNLSRSSTAIYFSNSYSLDDRIQSEERIVHVTKDEPLLFLDLITKDSIQEDILKALRTKNKNARYFMGDVIANTRTRSRIE